MSEHARRFRLLPLAALLCVGACMSTEGYYRYQDAGPSGAAGDGTPGSGGSAGDGGGGAGTTGSAGIGGRGGQTAGVAGNTATGTAGRGGTTGSAGSAAGRGGTTGGAGRGGTTGSAGATGVGGSAGVLFSDNFDPLKGPWDYGAKPMPPLMNDSVQMMTLNMTDTLGDQVFAAAGLTSWTNYSIEAKVKVLGFTGTSSSDGVAICARLTGVESFYYFIIQAGDLKGKIKINNGSNSSLSSSLDASGFAMNTWITMRLDVVGYTLTAYLNGTMRGTYTVPATETANLLPTGGIALMVQRANVLFDDVIVRSLP
jgi:hypothetical protein